MSKFSQNEATAAEKAQRKYVSQTDIPRIPLQQALRVPRALADQYAKKPTRPFEVALALGMSPTSGTFRNLCGAAIGYGFVEGGAYSAQISLTSLGQRIVAPVVEGDDVIALRQAALVPLVQKQFLEKYDGSQIPTERIGQNVLEQQMGVPAEFSRRVLSLILENANHVGFIKQIKDKNYVDLGISANTSVNMRSGSPAGDSEDLSFEAGNVFQSSDTELESLPIAEPPQSARAIERNRKIFLSHGKGLRVVNQLKELLQLGEFEAVVSVERESVSMPVSKKVLNDMRLCGAGIIHIRPEEKMQDEGGNEHGILNQNVLIEIGAAMALYGDDFILLVEDGTQLPSNLQGLYEVRYSGDELGYDATMKVLKALNQFKAGPK